MLLIHLHRYHRAHPLESSAIAENSCPDNFQRSRQRLLFLSHLENTHEPTVLNCWAYIYIYMYLLPTAPAIELIIYGLSVWRHASFIAYSQWVFMETNRPRQGIQSSTGKEGCHITYLSRDPREPFSCRGSIVCGWPKGFPDEIVP